MNVAKKVGWPDTVKAHGLFRSGLVQPQIKSLSPVERKNIVKPRIVIRKIHHTAHRHDEQTGLESLVALLKTVMRARRGGAHRLYRINGCQPSNDPGRVLSCAPRTSCNQGGLSV